MLGLYIHIPFCKTLCSYCDFCKFINQTNDKIDRYLDYLISEIESHSHLFDEIDTIYIGGGTPNSLTTKQLSRLFRALDAINPKEYSIECNVEFINLEFIELLKTTKINRISIGVQTFNNHLIKIINRNHTEDMAKEKIKLLIDNGYKNINIDMIYAIPTQTISDLKYDLEVIKSLDIKHISYYSLILEEKSVMGIKYKENNLTLIDEDLDANMSELVIDYLKDIGFKHYEISNFCKDNYESIHNMIYWSRENYIGCGCSAAGYYNGVNTINSSIMSKYLDGNKEIEEITKDDCKREFFWLGLRMIDGVNLDLFKQKYNEDPFELYDINKLINLDLVCLNNNNLKLTRKGILLGNIVFEEFL